MPPGKHGFSVGERVEVSSRHNTHFGTRGTVTEVRPDNHQIIVRLDNRNPWQNMFTWFELSRLPLLDQVAEAAQ